MIKIIYLVTTVLTILPEMLSSAISVEDVPIIKKVIIAESFFTIV